MLRRRVISLSMATCTANSANQHKKVTRYFVKITRHCFLMRLQTLRVSKKASPSGLHWFCLFYGPRKRHDVDGGERVARCLCAVPKSIISSTPSLPNSHRGGNRDCHWFRLVLFQDGTPISITGIRPGMACCSVHNLEKHYPFIVCRIQIIHTCKLPCICLYMKGHQNFWMHGVNFDLNCILSIESAQDLPRWFAG